MSDEPSASTSPERSNASSPSTVVEGHELPVQGTQIHAPVPKRPALHSRKSSGTLIVPKDSCEVGPVPTHLDPDDVRAMSPRRSSEDLENMGRETREELQRHARLLSDSLTMVFSRLDAVREEHDKLDNNNKFLQKYIGDLMSTSKITASRGRK